MNHEIRKLEIMTYFQGYMDSCQLGMTEEDAFIIAKEATTAKYQKWPIFKTALKEVIKELEEQ